MTTEEDYNKRLDYQLKLINAPDKELFILYLAIKEELSSRGVLCR